MIDDIGSEILAAAAYSAAGIVLMVLGFVVIDVLTPGRLRDLIWVERSVNAAVIVVCGMLGSGLIVVTAILASENDLGEGIVSTLGYGLLGLVVMALAFFVVDLATPGKLGELVTDKRPHPAAWVTGAAHLVTSAVVAAAIS
jgi:uncharacterized membrane protein YjfL (UPF0719 family)